MVFLEHSRVPEIHPKKRGIERFSSFSIRKLSRQTFTVVDTEAPASPTSGRMEIPPQQGHHFKWICFQLPIFGIFRGVLDRFSGGVHGSTNFRWLYSDFCYVCWFFVANTPWGWCIYLHLILPIDQFYSRFPCCGVQIKLCNFLCVCGLEELDPSKKVNQPVLNLAKSAVIFTSPSLRHV